jgi:hypothetical protein
LSTIAMDGGGWEVLVDQEIRERVCHTLGLDEDQCKTCTMSVENIKKDRALVHVLDIFNLL